MEVKVPEGVNDARS